MWGLLLKRQSSHIKDQLQGHYYIYIQDLFDLKTKDVLNCQTENETKRMRKLALLSYGGSHERSDDLRL